MEWNRVRWNGIGYEMSSLPHSQLKEVQMSLATAKSESCELSERFSAMESSWGERERGLLEQCQRLEGRVADVTQQNSLLHDEAEKVTLKWFPHEFFRKILDQL